MQVIYDVSHNIAKVEEHVRRPAVARALELRRRTRRADMLILDSRVEPMRGRGGPFVQWFDGRPRKLLVHRKGSTRAFPPHHPLIPVDYQFTGQPVLIGGTMGTCSYVLTGTEQGMQQTFGSTCHGAVRPQRVALRAWLHANERAHQSRP